MREVVHGKRGTAKNLSKGIEYEMAGKTGTAQVIGIAQNAVYNEEEVAERHRHHGLFIAFAPMEAPDHRGGHHCRKWRRQHAASPIARAVIDTWLLGRRRADGGLCPADAAPGFRMTWPAGPAPPCRFHIDVPLLLLLLALTAYGLLVLYSASGQSMGAVIRQGRYFCVAYVIMILGAQISLQRYMRWAPWLYLVGVGTLVAVMFVGVGAKGAQRWLSIGGFRFQPSEIMKLVVPLAVAWYLADRILPPRFFVIGRPGPGGCPRR